MNATTSTVDRSDRGVTLLELVITMAVMMIATAIIAPTLLLAQRVTNSIERTGTAIDDARLVSATLDRELRSADCISLPKEKESGNTLSFRTVLSGEFVVLTYLVADGEVTRRENLGEPRTVIGDVGSTTRAFQQMSTPLRTVLVTIPIRSENGGEFNLRTTIAGRNAWRTC